LYQSAKAFAGDMKKNYGLRRPWIFGNDRFAWFYSTQYNTGPLGYELYFTSYFRAYDKFCELYLKYGRPFKNTGGGIEAPELVHFGRVSIGGAVHLWSQDMYGVGGAGSIELHCQVYKGFGALLDGGWKSEGYLPGWKLEQTPLVLGGVNYWF
jgi:hypothetical protein